MSSSPSKVASRFFQAQDAEDKAKACHDIWSHWMKSQFSVGEKQEDGSVLIPKDKVSRWERQMATAYADLSEKEKESDREVARKFLSLTPS